jgi:hypothetical protein
MTTILTANHTIPVTNGGVITGTFTTSQSNSTGIAFPNSGVGSPTIAAQLYSTTNIAAGLGVHLTNPTQLGNNVLTAKHDPPEIEVKGRMIINGVDLEERLNTIEKALCIPERDVILERKHPKLKKLYDEYITALAKYRTFQAIKGDE